MRLPDEPLPEAILRFAAPLLEPLGRSPNGEAARRAVARAVEVWNAHVLASQVWGPVDAAPLAALRKAVRAKAPPVELAASFKALASRWSAELRIDPRLVGEWSLVVGEAGQLELTCEVELPEGVEAMVPPPAEKRIAIGGKFLDEVTIRASDTMSLAFSVGDHRAEVGADGAVRVHTRIHVVAALFAEGRLAPVGGTPVDLVVGGKILGPHVLADVRCPSGSLEVAAELIFRPAGRMTSR